MFHNLEGGSTGTPRSLMLDISKESLCKVSLEGNSFRNPKLADAVESSPAADARKGKDLLYRVSPADGLFDSTVCEELADGALDSCYKCNAEVSLDGQSHEQSKQHKSVNYDVVPIEVIAPCANLDVSNPKSSLKGRAKRKRIAKVSSQMLVPKENTGILVPSDQICVETPTSELVERSSGDEILQGTPRSRMTKTPLSYVHHSPLTRSKSKALSVATSQCVKMKRSKVHRSPLTRSKSKSLSIATPESVKIKQSRSGRLIVPRLDPGSQNITYGPDGCICGITNLEASFPQGISSEPPSKRRMSQRLSPDLYRLLTF